MKNSLIATLLFLCSSVYANPPVEVEVENPPVVIDKLPIEFEGLPIFMPEEIRLERNREFEIFSGQGSEFASGSDIIGNGAGLAEQNVQYMLRQLDRHLVMCLNDHSCLSSSRDKGVLRKLLDLSLTKRGKTDAVLFLNGADFETVFANTGDTDQRIAKTGFSPKFPVFINVSAIYKNGLESDLSYILGLLVHEFGHQLGIASHTYLDSLAASIRSSFDRFYRVYALDNYGVSVELAHFSAPHSESYDYGVLDVDGSKFSFSAGLDDSVCPSGGKLVGLRWSNIHFQRPSNRRNGLELSAQAWGSAYCADAYDLHLPAYVLPINLNFDFSLSRSENQSWVLDNFSTEFSE